MKNPRSLEELIKQISLRKIPFFVVFFVIVMLTYAVLYVIDFIPEPITDNAMNTSTLGLASLPQAGLVRDAVSADVAQESEEYVVLASVDAGTTGEYTDGSSIAEAQPTITAQLRSESPTLNTEPLFNEVPEFPHTIIFDSLNGRSISILNPRSREIADLDEALLSGVVRHPDSADLRNVGNIFILGHSSYLPNVLNRNFQAFNGVQKLTWGDRIRLISDAGEYIYRVERVYEALASEVIVPFTPGEARLTLATCDSFGSKDDRFMVEAVLIGKQAL